MSRHWSIVKTDDGEYEVYHGSIRKRVWPSIHTALRWLATKVKEGERVYQVEADGYRIDITRRNFRPFNE